jgi:hypothetical protein
MIWASWSKKLVRTCPVSHSDWTNAPAAWRSWLTVRCGFFPPPLLMDLGQEQMADRRQEQVPFQRGVVADLEVVHAQLVFLFFEAALDVEALERHVQHDLQRRARRGVGNEARIQL